MIKHLIFFYLFILFSCANSNDSDQKIDIDKENLGQTDTTNIESKEKEAPNTIDTVNYARIFDKSAFCMQDADTLTAGRFCRDQKMTDAHYSFFHLDPNYYNGDCYLVSVQEKLGDFMTVIIACDDAPFSEQGWLYTIDKDFQIIDSLLIFEYEGTSGTDDFSIVSKESNAVLKNNSIKVTEINSLNFRDIDTTLTIDTTIWKSEINENGNITTKETFYQKYNESITEDPNQCGNYYVHTISENESIWIKTNRVYNKIKAVGVHFKDQKSISDFEINDYLTNNKLEGTDVEINNQNKKDVRKEKWNLEITDEGIVVTKNEGREKRSLFTKSDFYSMPEKIRSDYYFMRN